MYDLKELEDPNYWDWDSIEFYPGSKMFIITPEQSANMARDRLQKAMKYLADAQSAVAEALETLSFFESNFRSGKYRQSTTEELYKTITSEDYQNITTVDAIKKAKKK